MAFSIRLSSDLVAVEAGASAPVTVTIENKGSTVEHFEMDIEGIDAEWNVVPVPVIACESNAATTERFFFKPPRASESLAGNYPFVVRVRSLESGEARTVQGVLEVRPFHHLSMEINPKRGVISWVSHQNTFDVTVVNLGNTSHTIRLQGNDPEDALAFEFEQDQIVIGPGQQREVAITTVPTTSRVISSARLIGFTVTGRSVDVPSVVTSTQAQLEQRFFFSPTSLIVILAFILLGIGWYLAMPKPPTITSFSAEPDVVEAGSRVTLKWSAPDASAVHITADGNTVTDESLKTGEYQFSTPVDTGKDRIVFELVAERNGRKSEPARVTVQVRQPEIVPDPKIDKLSVDKNRVKLGDPFVLSYRFNGAVTKAVLSPDNIELDPALPNRSITPTSSGKVTYTVTAYNKANKTVAKTFTVSVYDQSDATVLSFIATPNPVQAEEGKVTLTWSVMKAARIQIKASGRPLSIDETASSGTLEVPIRSKTTYTLTAYDEEGRATSQSQVVTVVQPPATEPGPPTEDEPPVVPPEDSGNGTVPPPTTTGGGP